MTSTRNIDQLLREFWINGYVVFDDFIEPEAADELHGALEPLLENVRAIDSRTLSGSLTTGRGRVTEPLRYKVDVPWVDPFSDPGLYENPDALSFFERLWGTNDFLITDYISYHPCPGCDALYWHRDGELLAPNVVPPSFPSMSLKIALVDTNELNGSFEMMPSTHYCGIAELSHVPGSEHAADLDRVIKSGRYPSKSRLNLKKGSAFVCDPRLIHRGTPNRSDHVRMELDIGYALPWYDPRNAPLEIPRDAFDSFSARGRQLLCGAQIVEAID
jgi:hypothetical protein